VVFFCAKIGTARKPIPIIPIENRQWGDILLHIFDRGYASGPWIQVLQSLKVKFVIRWKKGISFSMQMVNRRIYSKLGKGRSILFIKKSMMCILVKRCLVICGWAPVWHPAYTYQLYVVKVRVRKKFWYLITNEQVRTENQAWEIVLAYRGRWQIETSFRYGKSELAMESPRLWFFENRLKLLGIVTIVYTFLLHLPNPIYKNMIVSVLSLKCHRTGKRCREMISPLYRLRWAISRLWNDHHRFRQNSEEACPGERL
jgi:Transposase DDE domain